MKISKRYLKQVINEEYKKIINEASYSEDVFVKMKASEYLKLTTDEGTLKLLHKAFRKVELDRKPNPRDTITLEKK